MRMTRRIAILGLSAATATAIACSDSGPFQPQPGAGPALSSSKGADTAHTKPDSGKTTPPDSGKKTPPDSGKHAPPDTIVTHPDSGHGGGGTVETSFDPRTITGIVKGAGTTGMDSASFTAVGGATVVLSAADAADINKPGVELGHTVTKSDGSFEVGKAKPGFYWLTVTPPAGSPFAKRLWPFMVVANMPATVSVFVSLMKQ